MKQPIMLDALVKAGACAASLDEFVRLFDKGPAEVSMENLSRVMNTVYLAGSAYFAAAQFLSMKQFERFINSPAQPHASYSAENCPGCRAEWVKFIEIYNEEEEKVDVQKVPG